MGCLFKRKTINKHNVMIIKYNIYESVLGVDYVTHARLDKKAGTLMS